MLCSSKRLGSVLFCDCVGMFAVDDMNFDNLPEQIKSKVRFEPCPVDNLVGDCWVWTSATRGRVTQRYGTLTVKGKSESVHRFVFMLLGNIIPEGLVLDHLCEVPLCLNPKHLKPVTQRVNILRGRGAPAINSRKTHCPKGHAFDKENTQYAKNGQRVCRECHKIRLQRWNSENKEWKRNWYLSHKGESPCKKSTLSLH